LFNRKQLIALMIPLIIEQTLTVTVGIADSMMVAAAGETAVAGVSLVDSINNLMLSILAALATGGAVVCSQYLGKKRGDLASQAADQLMLSSAALALAASVFMFLFNKLLLGLVFPKTEEAVMNQAATYFFWISMTYPFMSIYNSGAALFRSMGNSRISMLVSILMNVLNICGNAVLIFGLHMGVAGAAIATLISRIVGAAILFWRVSMPAYELHTSGFHLVRPDFTLVRKIMSVGIPSGMENGLFQVGKIITASIVAVHGTAQILASSVSFVLATFMLIPGQAVSLAMITVVGQSIGAGRIKEARSYTWKLLAASSVSIAVMSFAVLALRPVLLGAYHMSDEAYNTAWHLLFLHTVIGIPIWPFSFNLPNALRAGNDATFTMAVSLISMWTFRVGLSWLLGAKYAATGVWYAMFIDWTFRSIVFTLRFRTDKWYAKRLV
jgi:putative MATE family efflux protein